MDYGLTCKTIKSSEKNQEKIFRIYGKAKGSYTWSTKKEKFDKWEFYWNFLKAFCSLKDPVERTKRKVIDRRKYLETMYLKKD